MLLSHHACAVFLKAPKSTHFGIDFTSWDIGPLFKGLKLIPPGWHFVHYNLKNGFKTGFFHYFNTGEGLTQVAVWNWDPDLEEFAMEQDQDQVERIKYNIGELDPSLGYYPHGPTPQNPVDTKEKWIHASSYITGRILAQILPNGMSVSSMSSSSRFSDVWAESKRRDLESVSKLQQRSADVHGRDAIPTDKQQADAASGKATLAEPSQDMASLEKANWINFTPIDLKASYPSGSDPSQITKYSLDKSFLVASLLKSHYAQPSELLAEMQLCFILFYFAQLYDGFEQWKTIVYTLCHCGEAIPEFPQLFEGFVGLLKTQLEDFPLDFFQDELSSSSFLEECFVALIDNVREWPQLLTLQERLAGLLEFIERRFEWDLGHQFVDLDELDGEDAPVVVQEGASTY
ncbi:a1-alpha2 repression [Kappamyces sp. JEL0680]|nr:a1-alpha2 repression [Kappamyces sp. JEL0680]